MEKVYFRPQSEGKLQHRGEPHQRKGPKQLVTSHRIRSLEAQRDAACFCLLIKFVMSVLGMNGVATSQPMCKLLQRHTQRCVLGDSRSHPIEDQF